MNIERGRRLRLALAMLAALWGAWFLLVQAALWQENGSLSRTGPAEAHDLPDLLVWAALTAWTYATPFLLLGAWLTRRRR